MNLSAPTTWLFIVAVVIALLAVLAAMGIFSIIPIASVWLMTIAFVILAAGCLFPGI